MINAFGDIAWCGDMSNGKGAATSDDEQRGIEVCIAKKGEGDVCMQSDDRNLGKPKPLVIHFTRDVTTQRPKVSSSLQLRRLRPSLIKVIRCCHGNMPHKGLTERRMHPSYGLKRTCGPLKLKIFLVRVA